MLIKWNSKCMAQIDIKMVEIVRSLAQNSRQKYNFICFYYSLFPKQNHTTDSIFHIWLSTLFVFVRFASCVSLSLFVLLHVLIELVNYGTESRLHCKVYTNHWSSVGSVKNQIVRDFFFGYFIPTNESNNVYLIR